MFLQGNVESSTKSVEGREAWAHYGGGRGGGSEMCQADDTEPAQLSARATPSAGNWDQGSRSGGHRWVSPPGAGIPATILRVIHKDS